MRGSGSLLDVVLLEGAHLPQLRVQRHALLERRKPRAHVLQGVLELRLQEELHLQPDLLDRLLSLLPVGHPPEGSLPVLQLRQGVHGLRQVLPGQQGRHAAHGLVPRGGRRQDLPGLGQVGAQRMQRRQRLQRAGQLLPPSRGGRPQQGLGVHLHPLQADAHPADIGRAPRQDRLQLGPDPSDVLVAGLRLDLQLQRQLGHAALQLVGLLLAPRSGRGAAARARPVRRRQRQWRLGARRAAAERHVQVGRNTEGRRRQEGVQVLLEGSPG